MLLLKPYAKQIAVIIACIVVSSTVSIIIPLIGKTIMDEGFLAKNLSVIISMATVSLLLILTEQGIGFLETKYFAYINTILPYNLTKSAFKHMLKLKMQYFQNSNMAEIISQLSMDIGNITKITDQSMFFIITQAFKIVGGLVGLLLIDWKLTMLVILMLPMRYFFVRYIAKKRKNIFEEYIKLSKEYSSWYGDAVGGIKEIKLWGLNRIMLGMFIKKQRVLIKKDVLLLLIDKINFISETLLFQIITSALYIVGAYFMINGKLTVGELFTIITYSVFVTGPVSAIFNIGYSFSGILPSAKRYFEFMNTDIESDLKDAKRIPDNKSKINECLEFKDVSFSYSHNHALQNISFRIKRGEKVAIIGPNGSGKSTLLNLILRLCSPDKGSILLDSIDIRLYKINDYRKLISVVNQDVYLFNGSIKDNIALFSKRKNKRIIDAGRQSGADAFIERLPDKYETSIGNNGSKLSGGERQKLAIARALAKKAPILAMDEATSNCDAVSELLINEVISSYSSDTTAVIITHKPDLLKRVDKIIALFDGKVVDIGTHDELYKRNDFYREMFTKNDVVSELNTVINGRTLP